MTINYSNLLQVYYINVLFVNNQQQNFGTIEISHLWAPVMVVAPVGAYVPPIYNIKHLVFVSVFGASFVFFPETTWNKNILLDQVCSPQTEGYCRSDFWWKF